MSIKTENGRMVMVPRELTGEAVDLFDNELKWALTDSPATIELNCSALHLVSSSHVNLLWSARERCEAADIPMRLTHVSDRLTRTLKILDLIEFFNTDEVAESDCKNAPTRPSCDIDAQHLQIRLKPVNEEILDALGRFRQFLKDLKINPLCALELETVFYEILTNIRQHAQTESGLVVELSAKAGPDAIELTFTDNGHRFNPGENVRQFDPAKAVRTGQRHGFGLTMIARMTDAMDYERKNNELNVLKVKKYWK